MKETIFDVLMYLLENYMDNELEMLPDSDAVVIELLEAGFGQPEVTQAFNWLESLNQQRAVPVTSPTFRIFCEQEMARLDVQCRNLIMFLEQIGILQSTNREIVIDRVMALENEEISLEKLKWIILMVLLSQPDEEIAFARMEDIVYNSAPTYLH